MKEEATTRSTQGVWCLRNFAAQSERRPRCANMAHCPNCGGELKTIAAILEQPVMEKILSQLGLQARAPPRAPARGSQLQAA